jgi:hypothetical protein
MLRVKKIVWDNKKRTLKIRSDEERQGKTAKGKQTLFATTTPSSTLLRREKQGLMLTSSTRTSLLSEA